jgi:hypothetical protein
VKQWGSADLALPFALPEAHAHMALPAVWARRGGRSGEREGTHPSYQAWSYTAYLQDFNAAVQDGAMTLRPCAYLHNYPRDDEIDHPHYRAHLERSPLFLARERAKLQALSRERVRHGDSKGALYAIENGRIRSSKLLIDSVAGLLQGKPEFVLIDDQRVAHDSILEADARGAMKKQVVIVQGGTGTGKSVIAINLLGVLIARKRNVHYMSQNAAPRAALEAELAGTFTKTRTSSTPRKEEPPQPARPRARTASAHRTMKRGPQNRRVL